MCRKKKKQEESEVYFKESRRNRSWPGQEKLRNSRKNSEYSRLLKEALKKPKKKEEN